MKIYTKKEASISEGPFFSFVVGLLFSGIPLGYFVVLYVIYGNSGQFFQVLIDGIFLNAFALFFFWCGVMILKYVFKRPIKKVAKLTEKFKEDYNGKKIISMTFTVETEKGNFDYTCYTKEENDFILNERYIIRIRELDNRLLNIFPFNGDEKTASDFLISEEIRIKKGMEITSNGVVWVIVAPTMLIWIKVLYDIITNTGYVGKYDGTFFFALIFFTFFAFLVLVVNRKFLSNINNNDKKNGHLDLSKYPVLDKEIYITNPIRKFQYRKMKLMFIYWLFVDLFFIILFSLNGFNNIFIIIIICNFPLVFFELIEVFELFKYYNFDEKALKEYEINTNNTVILNNTKFFKIIRVSREIGVYYIVDDKKNLLFKVINKPWSNKYCILDCNNKLIGEINRRIFSLTLEDTYIIRLIGKSPIGVQARLEINYSYDVYNTNYSVIGNYVYNSGYNGMQSVILENNKDIAYIQFRSSKYLYHFSYANINIVESGNNEEVIFIAMSVILGNQGRFKSEIER